MSCLDDEMINLMCKSCRKAPINDPPAQAAYNAAATWVTREGHNVGMIQENALDNAMFFYVKYQNMTSRVTNPAEITVETLKPIGDFKKLITGMINPSIDEAPKLTHDWIFEFFDKFKVFLNENV